MAQGPLERCASEALGLGASALEVEYRDGHEEVVAMSAGVGAAIARFPSGSREAAQLREELHALIRRKRRLAVGGEVYELRASHRDSFGELLYRIEFRRLGR